MHVINCKCKNSGVFFGPVGSKYMHMWKFFQSVKRTLCHGKFPLLHHVKANRLCIFYGSMQCYGTGSIYGSRLELMRKFCVFCALAGHGFDHLATGKKRRHFL